jgi:death-on-curing protein
MSAAADAFHTAENQPFMDGNKRTALEPNEELYQAMIQLADKKLDKTGLARPCEYLSQK